MDGNLRIGLTGEAEVKVTEENTAQALDSGHVPVFGTPALVALLEKAAVKAVTAYLGEGRTSVGVHLDVRHLAATPPGMIVRAEARLTAIDGRRLSFEVSACDEIEQVATGTHQRVIVGVDRFLTRARAKYRDAE